MQPAERNTDSLIGAVADEIASEGIELIDSTLFCKDQLPPWSLDQTKAERIEASKHRIWLEIANEIARLDLGQTIVVRDKACVAIEAMEGTDAMIQSASELATGD